jgi:hypothetical protein
MRLTSSAAVLVLLWAPGCGGEDGSFTEDYNRAVTPISTLAKDMKGRPAELERLAERTRRARANLAAVDAPEGARDELERVRAELGAVTRALTAVAGAARARDPVRHRRALRRLEASNARVGRAERALQRAVAG